MFLYDLRARRFSSNTSAVTPFSIFAHVEKMDAACANWRLAQAAPMVRESGSEELAALPEPTYDEPSILTAQITHAGRESSR
jgi:hypothetical protein